MTVGDPGHQPGWGAPGEVPPLPTGGQNHPVWAPVGDPVGWPAPTGAPVPPTAPQSVPAVPKARRQPGLITWVAVGVTVSSLAISTAVLASDPSPSPSTNASTLLARPGHHEILGDANGTIRTYENTPLTGAKAFLAGPTSFLAHGLDLPTSLAMTWWRSSVVERSTTGAATRVDVLQSATVEGLRTHVINTPDGFQAFQPGILTLPSTVTAGATWNASGTVLVGRGGSMERQADYTFSASARATTTPGCLEVTSTLTVSGIDSPQVTTWCPDRGIVATSESGKVWQSLSGFPQSNDPRSHVTTAASMVPLDARAASWKSFAVSGLPLAVSVGQPPTLTGQGAVVAVRGNGDLLGITIGKTDAVAAWRANPGDLITAQASFGDVTVVSTAARTLVAYDASGQWLWTTPTADVTQSRPVALDDDHLVATFVDGRVAAYDLRTGAKRWEHSLGLDVQLPAAVDRGLVYVATGDGELHALGAADGREVWTRAFGDPLVSLSAARGQVVGVSTIANAVVAFDGATGVPLWQAAERGNARTTVALADRLVVIRDTDIYALSETGKRVWTAPVTGSVGVSGSVLIVAGRDRVSAIDADGSTIASWDTPPRDTGVPLPWVAVTPAGDVLFIDASLALDGLVR